MELLKEILTLIGGLVVIITLCTAIIELIKIWIWKRKLNWDNSLRIARLLLEKIETNNWKPQIVLGLGRSGGIWGGLFIYRKKV
jgi:hypothetical protein